jgi:hypothetical protein
MVGDRAGMRMSTLTERPPDRRRIRFGAGAGVLGRVQHDLLDVVVDRLEAVLGDAGGFELGLQMVDRIAVLAHVVDLLLGPVLGRIRHGVAAIAVGLHLKDIGTLAAGVLGGPLAGGADGVHVHAVDLFARNAEADAALEQLGLGRGALDAGAHGVLVVLDHIDDRQLPQRGHVEHFVDLALVGRAVAEVGVGHVLVAAVLVGEAEAGADRHLGADDPVAAEKAGGDVEHVHRAALAMGRTARTAGQLGHDFFRIHAGGQHVAVVAIAGDDLVAVALDGFHADRDGLLADVEMAETADQTHAVKLSGALLETPDEQHRAVIAQPLIVVARRRGRISRSPGLARPRHRGLHPNPYTAKALGGSWLRADHIIPRIGEA